MCKKEIKEVILTNNNKKVTTFTGVK